MRSGISDARLKGSRSGRLAGWSDARLKGSRSDRMVGWKSVSRALERNASSLALEREAFSRATMP